MLAVFIAFIISHTAGISWRQYVAINLSTLKPSGKERCQCPKMIVLFWLLWGIFKIKAEMCTSPLQILVDKYSGSYRCSRKTKVFLRPSLIEEAGGSCSWKHHRYMVTKDRPPGRALAWAGTCCVTLRKWPFLSEFQFLHQ